MLDRVLVFDRWSLELAPGWEADVDEGCVVIAKPEGAGAILVSTAHVGEGTASRALLEDLAKSECPPQADRGDCQLGDFAGLHAMYESDGARWHRFYLSYGSLVLLVSYTVALEDEGPEDDDVQSMLRSLRGLGDPWR